MKRQSLFEEIKLQQIEYAYHASDLYIPVNQITIEILKHHPGINFREFINNDGNLWYDIPFAYDPFWENLDKQRKV